MSAQWGPTDTAVESATIPRFVSTATRFQSSGISARWGTFLWRLSPSSLFLESPETWRHARRDGFGVGSAISIPTALTYGRC
jgi:hypothetical protein